MGSSLLEWAWEQLRKEDRMGARWPDPPITVYSEARQKTRWPESSLFAETARIQLEKRLAAVYAEKTALKEIKVSVEQTVDQLIKAKQKQKEVDRRLAWIEAQGDDTYEDGIIVRFDKEYGERKKTYRYAAIKANGFWYTTSGAGVASRYCWNDFLLWLSEDNPEPTLYQQVDASTVEAFVEKPVGNLSA